MRIQSANNNDDHPIKKQIIKINFSKKEIVLEGKKLSAPFHLTWSCYQEEDEACGICDSCALRLRGFHLAGIEDPINYKTKPLYI